MLRVRAPTHPQDSSVKMRVSCLYKVVLALGEGYQQVVGGGAMRLLTYPPQTVPAGGVGAVSGGSFPPMVGLGLGAHSAARVVPYPQPQMQIPQGTRKYRSRLVCFNSAERTGKGRQTSAGI